MQSDREITIKNYDNYKFSAVVLGFLYCLYYVATRMDWHFIDNVNLIIHEAGHVVFILFGETMQVAGGSILQILIPLMFVLYFLSQRSYYSSIAMSFWAGISIINVSVYAADAVKMQLPLLTGDTEGHDWNQLLFHFGLLHNTDFVAGVIFATGIVCILVGFIFASILWFKSIYE